MKCEKCQRDLNERTETVWTFTQGWTKHRDAGGTNHIALRQELDRHICNGCMKLLQDGLDPGQQRLM